MEVFGLVIRPNDLLHADRHGAVIIDPEIAHELPRAIDLVTRKEAPILNAARSPGFTIDNLVEAWGEAEDIPLDLSFNGSLNLQYGRNNCKLS